MVGSGRFDHNCGIGRDPAGVLTEAEERPHVFEPLPDGVGRVVLDELVPELSQGIDVQLFQCAVALRPTEVEQPTLKYVTDCLEALPLEVTRLSVGRFLATASRRFGMSFLTTPI